MLGIKCQVRRGDPSRPACEESRMFGVWCIFLPLLPLERPVTQSRVFEAGRADSHQTCVRKVLKHLFPYPETGCKDRAFP